MKFTTEDFQLGGRQCSDYSVKLAYRAAEILSVSFYKQTFSQTKPQVRYRDSKWSATLENEYLEFKLLFSDLSLRILQNSEAEVLLD